MLESDHKSTAAGLINGTNTIADAERAELPGHFLERLGSVLRHYGVDSLDRTPELEAAVFRVFLAQKRQAADISIILGILDREYQERKAKGLEL